MLGGIVGQNIKFTDRKLNDKEALIKVLNKRLFALRKSVFLTSFKSRKMIANGLIMWKMVYLIPLWAGTEKNLLNSLQMIQNKAAIIVARKGKLLPVKVLLRECGWMSVVQLGGFHSLVTIYKIFQTKSPHYLYLKISSDCSRVLRTSSNLRIRLGNESQAVTELAKKSFKYRAARDWNMLPLEIKQIRKVETFKVMLKKWVSENISIS